MFEMSDRPPKSLSLHWLRLVVKSLGWLTAFCTAAFVVIYVGQQYFNDGYSPKLGNVVTTVCMMLAFGGILFLFFMGSLKIIEIWSEMINGGQHKTRLLEALLFDPVPHSDQMIESSGD